MRSRFRPIHFGVLIWLALLPCVVSHCQTVSVELKTKTGHNQFHVGEVVLLDLRFVATTPNAYERNRGIAFPEPYPMPDSFSIEPHEGWVDPLGDYRKALLRATQSGHSMIAGSTLLAENMLGPKPYILSLVLNDYVRFVRPGHYFLQVQDSGVTSVPRPPSATPQQFTLTSNRLELVIIPADMEWQQNHLRRILGTFAQLQQAVDSHARSYKSSLDESCVSLRAMGIPAAGTVMVDSLRDDDLFSTCSFQAGILEFPDLKFILVKLRLQLNDPDFPVTYTFFNTMAMVSLMAEGHADDLFGPNEEKMNRRLEQQLLPIVSLKRGKAKVVTIDTLVGMCFAPYGATVGVYLDADVPEELSRLRTQVLQLATANFDQLSPEMQTILRNYRNARGNESTNP